MIPILYESEHLSIQTLWVFVAIALLASSYLCIKRLKRARVNFNLFIEHSGEILLGSVVFSRIIYFIFNTDAYFPAFDLRTLWNFIAVWDQGFSLWGGIVGFLLMLSYRIYKANEELWKWYDALSVPMMIGLAIGNIGAFLGGAGYGTPSNLPWAVEYQSFSVKYTVPIHPTQIYFILIIGLILWSKQTIKKKTEFFQTTGNSSIYLATCMSFTYFLLEFIKGSDTIMIFGIRSQMIASLIIFLISGTLLAKRYKAYKFQ